MATWMDGRGKNEIVLGEKSVKSKPKSKQINSQKRKSEVRSQLLIRTHVFGEGKELSIYLSDSAI